VYVDVEGEEDFGNPINPIGGDGESTDGRSLSITARVVHCYWVVPQLLRCVQVLLYDDATGTIMYVWMRRGKHQTHSGCVPAGSRGVAPMGTCTESHGSDTHCPATAAVTSPAQSFSLHVCRWCVLL